MRRARRGSWRSRRRQRGNWPGTELPSTRCSPRSSRPTCSIRSHRGRRHGGGGALGGGGGGAGGRGGPVEGAGGPGRGPGLLGKAAGVALLWLGRGLVVRLGLFRRRPRGAAEASQELVGADGRGAGPGGRPAHLPGGGG